MTTTRGPLEDGSAKKEARLFYAGAVGFLVAAEATHERHLLEPGEPEHWPAISVNLCLAIELSLKSFLACHGVTRSELKSVGHSLCKALGRSEQCGLEIPHPAIPELLKILSPLHERHTLRYLEDRSTDLPEVRNMIAIVRALVLGVGAQLPVSDL